jgi:hypothetical protein
VNGFIARVVVLVAALLGGIPAGAAAQVFLAPGSHPDFTIGPLYIRAAVAPTMTGPLTVDIFWSLVIPAKRSAADVINGDLFLLWPSVVLPAPGLGPPDPALTKYLEERGLTAIEDGRLQYSARNLYNRGGGRSEPEPVPGGAPFVTYVRQSGALGLSAPATYVRIPWNPKLVNPVWIMSLRLQTKGLIKPKSQTWTEQTFWGPRSRLLLSFQDVNSRAVFPMYFEHRDRVVRLADDPAQLRIDFAKADHVKIDEISPPSARRQLSETQDNTETITLFLDRSEGIRPQTLTVQFGYFSDLQSWAPILIPIAFFALGNLAAPLVRFAAERLLRQVRARVHFGPPDRPGGAQNTVIPAETLARIKPGETTYDEVLRLCGPYAEEQEQMGGSGARTLIYRGRRLVPQRRRSWGWIGTVSHWEMEHQDVDITLEGNVVRDVQARIRRTRQASPDAPGSS